MWDDFTSTMIANTLMFTIAAIVPAWLFSRSNRFKQHSSAFLLLVLLITSFLPLIYNIDGFRSLVSFALEGEISAIGFIGFVLVALYLNTLKRKVFHRVLLGLAFLLTVVAFIMLFTIIPEEVINGSVITVLYVVFVLVNIPLIVALITLYKIFDTNEALMNSTLYISGGLKLLMVFNTLAVICAIWYLIHASSIFAFFFIPAVLFGYYFPLFREHSWVDYASAALLMVLIYLDYLGDADGLTHGSSAIMLMFVLFRIAFTTVIAESIKIAEMSDEKFDDFIRNFKNRNRAIPDKVTKDIYIESRRRYREKYVENKND